MKTLGLVCVALSCLLLSASTTTARMITLTVGGGITTNTVAIASGEVAELKFVYDPTVGGGPGSASFVVIKDDITFTISGSSLLPTYAAYRGNPIIAGPANISLRMPPGSPPGFATIEIAPESFPPDKTIIIPEGTGARVALECSTNLLGWSEVWSGSYTNVPASKFFRIKAERIP